jgi:uncharacterized iron-regulated membrane protein
MKLRKVIFWLHLTAGAMAGIVILVMCVTGVLLAFERQIIAFAERDARTVTPPASDMPRLDLDTLVANAREAVSGGTASTVVLSADRATATIVNFGREQMVVVDPYTGVVRGNGASTTRGFFRIVTDWHRWLGRPANSRESGRAVTGACNAAFMVLVMSGFYLWWPRRWRRLAVRTVTIPSLTLRGKPRDWNWHNAIGFWSAPVLLFITVTGLVISYQWAGNLLYTLTGNEPLPSQRSIPSPAAGGGAPDGRQDRQLRTEGGSGRERQGRMADEAESAAAPVRASLDALFATAVHQAPHWRIMTMRLPQRGATGAHGRGRWIHRPVHCDSGICRWCRVGLYRPGGDFGNSSDASDRPTAARLLRSVIWRRVKCPDTKRSQLRSTDFHLVAMPSQRMSETTLASQRMWHSLSCGGIA